MNALSQISWSCPTCNKAGQVNCDELTPSAYKIMALVKQSHKQKSPSCIVSYPNFSSPHEPRPEQPESELPKVYTVVMTNDEAFLVTMCMYLAQCVATDVEPLPLAKQGVKHWMDAVGQGRIEELQRKFQTIANIENMDTVLHIVYK